MRIRGILAAATVVALTGSADARVNAAEVATPRWVKVQTTAPEGGGPAPRKHHTGVYDPVGHRLVIFGGRNEDGALGDTWSLDLSASRWSEIKGDARPSARFGATAVYDAPRRRMLLFSGQAAGSFFNDVWALDLEQDRWSELKPQGGAAPKVRYGSAAIYDERRDRLVLFAGFTDQGRFNDTWALDLKEQRWIDLSPAGTRPVKRCLLTVAYDPLRDRMIVYAGQMTGHLKDTWAFDLAKNAWSEITGATTPPGRFFSALVYHPEKRRAVLFGGQSSDLGALDDSWALDLDADHWEALTPEGEARPAARSGHVAVYDPVGRQMVIFGGAGDESYSDVWALGPLAPPPGP